MSAQESILSASHFLHQVRALASEIRAGAAERDRQRRYPVEAIDRLRELGFWATTVPRKFGGLGLDQKVLVEAVQVLAAADGSLGQLPQNHFYTIERLRLTGSPAQQERYLTRVGDGLFFGNASAEACERAPSESATSLRKDADGWLLNGRKVYSTGALLADYISVLATDEAGLVYTVIVEQGAPGVEIIDDWDGLGQRTTASGTVQLTNVRVDDTAVLAPLRNPLQAYRISSLGQLLHAAIDVGLAEAAFDEAVELSRRVHGGRGSGAARFTEDVLGVARIGEMALELHTAQRLTEYAAQRLAGLSDRHPPQEVADVFHTIAQAKVSSTRAALSLTNTVFEIGGSSSARINSGLDRYWRDARTHTLHDAVRWKLHAIGRWHIDQAVADPWSIAHPYKSLDELQITS